MEKVIAKGSFIRSDTNQQVHTGQVVLGDSDYLDDLVKAGVARSPEKDEDLSKRSVSDPAAVAEEATAEPEPEGETSNAAADKGAESKDKGAAPENKAKDSEAK